MPRLFNCLFRHDAIWDIVIFVVFALLPMLAMMLALTRGVHVERDVMMGYILGWLLPLLLFMTIRLAVIIRDNRQADAERSPYRAIVRQHLRHAVQTASADTGTLSYREQEILLREVFDSVLREKYGS